MRLIFSDQPAKFTPGEKMIFLAGPTSRVNKFNKSWRKTAVEIFERLGFDGTLCIPEFSEERPFTDKDWDRQTDWEWTLLDNSTVIMFWVPREDKEMPGLTTNLEFGTYLEKCPERIVLGFPSWATHMQWMTKKYIMKAHATPDSQLEDTVLSAIALANSLYKNTAEE